MRFSAPLRRAYVHEVPGRREAARAGKHQAELMPKIPDISAASGSGPMRQGRRQVPPSASEAAVRHGPDFLARNPFTQVFPLPNRIASSSGERCACACAENSHGSCTPFLRGVCYITITDNSQLERGARYAAVQSIPAGPAAGQGPDCVGPVPAVRDRADGPVQNAGGAAGAALCGSG